MDFGFGSLVDKFEIHIGSRATAALLWLAAAAAFVICVKTIIIEGIVPFVHLVRGISSQSAWSVMGGILTGSAIALVSGAVFAGIVRWLVKRAVVPLVQRAQAHVQRAEQMTVEAETITAETVKRLDRLISNAERQNPDAGASALEKQANP